MGEPLIPGRTEGEVRWFSDELGYGFIQRADDASDLFVHFSQIEGTGHRKLETGDLVTFVVAQGRKGDEAKEVRVIS